MSKLSLLVIASIQLTFLATTAFGQVSDIPDYCDGVPDEECIVLDDQETRPVDFLQVSQKLGSKIIKRAEREADCDLGGSYSVAVPDASIGTAAGRNGSVVLLDVSALGNYITGEWSSESRPAFTGMISNDCKSGYVVFPDDTMHRFSYGSGLIQMQSGVSWSRLDTVAPELIGEAPKRRSAASSTASGVSDSAQSVCDLGGNYKVSSDFLSLDGRYTGSAVAVDLSERELTGRWTNSGRPNFSGMISADCTLGYVVFPDNTIQKFSYVAGSGVVAWLSGGMWTKGVADDGV